MSYSFRMRFRLPLLALALLAAPLVMAQSSPNLTLQVADDSEHFTYTIAHPEQAQRAWLEVYDWPLLLDQRPIRVQARGELAWAWDHSQLIEFEDDDEILSISLWDPNGETITCDENTVMTASPGGEVSLVDIGRRDGEKLDRIKPYRSKGDIAVITGVYPFPVRLMGEQGPDELKIIIRGRGFKRENRVILHAGHYATGDKPLQTQYVSENTLWTWIPRQYWRKHKFLYRLVTETAGGQRTSTEVTEAPEAE